MSLTRRDGDCQNPELEIAVAEYLKSQNDEAMSQVIRCSERLIRHFAQLYAHDQDNDDLYQAGCEGLLKALKRFDPDRGVMFSTYASHCILGEIRAEIRREKSFYRPSWVIELQNKVLKETEKVIKETGQTPTLEEVAQRANIKKEGLGLIMQVGRVPLDELDRSLVRSQRYVSFQLPIEDKLTLHQAMKSLSKVQQRVLYLSYYQDMTQQQIADELGISQRQVSRVLKRGLVVLAEQI